MHLSRTVRILFLKSKTKSRIKKFYSTLSTYFLSPFFCLLLVLRHCVYVCMCTHTFFFFTECFMRSSKRTMKDVAREIVRNRVLLGLSMNNSYSCMWANKLYRKKLREILRSIEVCVNSKYHCYVSTFLAQCLSLSYV